VGYDPRVVEWIGRGSMPVPEGRTPLTKCWSALSMRRPSAPSTDGTPPWGLRQASVFVLHEVSLHNAYGNRLNLNQGAPQEPPQVRGINMPVHTISLLGAIVLLGLALLLLFIIGPVALLILIIVGALFWWAFGPGNRVSLST
jgi:hypothetical protein